MPSIESEALARQYWEEAAERTRRMHGTDEPEYVLAHLRQQPGIRRKHFKLLARICESEKKSRH